MVRTSGKFSLTLTIRDTVDLRYFSVSSHGSYDRFRMAKRRLNMSNRIKLSKGKFSLRFWKKILIVSPIRLWKKLPREMVDASSLVIYCQSGQRI